MRATLKTPMAIWAPFPNNIYILQTRQMVLRRSLRGMKLKMCKITSSESSVNCAMN